MRLRQTMIETLSCYTLTNGHTGATQHFMTMNIWVVIAPILHHSAFLPVAE